jgi:hypothetical protein
MGVPHTIVTVGAWNNMSSLIEEQKLVALKRFFHLFLSLLAVSITTPCKTKKSTQDSSFYLFLFF